MTLGFSFSRNMSIEKWDKLGLLDREKLIYEKHLKDNNLEKVYWFTYGANDSKYQKDVNDKIYIVPMPKVFDNKIGINIYSFLMPFIQKKYLKDCDIYKNDQMDGSWSVVIAKLLYKKKLLIRTGFTLSLFMKQKSAKIKEFIGLCMEKFAYGFCDFATVSSEVSKRYIVDKFTLKETGVKVMYNYIDTDKFKPSKELDRKDRLLFIGRFDDQKNIKNLLKAMQGLGIGLDLYGDGVLKDELISISEDLKIDVNFLGKVANSKMPEVINGYKYYVLPSLYEGMPKTLLEAMSCGVICIGTDTLGINEVISDKDNGYLIYGNEANDIADGIVNAVESKEEEKIKSNARQTIIDVFSLDTYASNEFKIFKNMVKANDS